MEKKKKRISPLRETAYRFCRNKVSLIGLFLVILLAIIIVFGEQIVPYEFGIKQNYSALLQKPSAEHWFGTDGYGRDIFSRIIHGAKYTIILSVPAAFLAQLIGVILGALAAFYSKWLDEVLMRILDVFQAIPSLLLALPIVAALGASLPNLVFAMMVARVAGATRSARAVMLSLVGQEHIEAARSYGSRDYQLILSHVIPNAIGPMIVDFTVTLSTIILEVSCLSFMGLGVQPPTPEWGVLLDEAREFMRVAPHTIMFPGLAILLAALAFNLVGDGLRDALDPKLRD